MSIYRSADIDIDAVIAKMACIKAEGWAAAVLHFENTARNLWTDVIIFWQSANNAIELRRILNAENTIYRSLRSKPWKGDLWGSRMRIYPKIFWLAPCQLMVALRLDSLPKILRPHPNCQKNLGVPLSMKFVSIGQQVKVTTTFVLFSWLAPL